jgi:hypothetical protein
MNGAVPKSYKEGKWGKQISVLWESVKKRVSLKRAAIHRGLQRGSCRISTVKSRYQRTAGENIAGWKN